MHCDLHEVDSCVSSVRPSFILVKVNVSSVSREESVSQDARRTVKWLIVSVSSAMQWKVREVNE